MNLLLSILNETRSFAEIISAEWIGMIASTFILISFFFTKQTLTRLINLCGCIVFVIYGILLPSYSTALMNLALIVVHIVYISKDIAAKKKQKDAPANTEDPCDKAQEEQCADLSAQPTETSLDAQDDESPDVKDDKSES